MTGHPVSQRDKARTDLLGLRLRTARELIGREWSRERLARESGVSAAEIEKIELGRARAPRFFIVADLARALELDLDDLERETRPS
jgi:transcriptional regulator with XRE-family HTH domain